MKRLTIFAFFAITFCLTSISSFAQQRVIYLGQFGEEKTAANYFIKRVITYKEPWVIYISETGYYGDTTPRVRETGLHYCTVTDYLKTGELWFVGKAISSDVRCFKLDGYEGQATYYYRENSKILRQESWQDGKKHGVQITYDKGGNEILREEYVKGEKIDTSKFSVSAENPIIGTWKYVECTNNDCTEFKGYEALGGKSLPATIVRTSTYIYFQNGVVESVHETMLGTSKVKGNWKYTSKNDSSGVLEEFLGSDLVERGNVKFLSRNQLEYTITFSKNTDSIGKQYVWARQ